MIQKPLNPYWMEIVSIVEAGLKPDPSGVAQYSAHLARRLEQSGEPRLAARLDRLVQGASRPSGSLHRKSLRLADVEAQLNLVEETRAHHPSDYPVLERQVESELSRFVELQRRAAELESIGVDRPSSLLLYGVPGCGKTMAAEALAADLDLPLLTLRLEAVLASYLGSSAKNLRRLFEGAESRPCVLLMDEFDAVGKMRDDPQEIGEIKRLVTSLLQNLDRVRGRLLVVAATNHPQLLDPALWRRFDLVMHFGVPHAVEAEQILRRELGGKVYVDEASLAATGQLCEGLSGASIVLAANRAMQNTLLLPNVPIARLLTREVLRQQSGPEASIPEEDDVAGLVAVLGARFGEYGAQAKIARLVATSPQNVHRILCRRSPASDGEEVRRCQRVTPKRKA